jgi:hypothetical protein
VTDTARGDPDEHLARPRRTELEVLNAGGLAGLFENDGTHRRLL